MKNTTIFRLNRAGKHGTVTMVASLLLLTAIVLLNVLVGVLPAKVTRFDVAFTGLSDMAEESKKLVGSLKEDVTIYWICEEGVVDASLAGWFELLLTRYDEASEHVTVKQVDTATDTAFAEKYETEYYNNNSVVVESARRFTVVDVMELMTYTSAFLNQNLYEGEEVELTMDELAQMREMMYAYGVDIMQYQIYNHSSRANAELTAAMDYVVSETLPTTYLLTGFGGTELSEELVENFALLSDGGLKELDLSAATAIPADAGCVILYGPTTDLTEAQTAVLKAYLDRGGSMTLATAPSAVEDCPHLQSLVSDFGLSAELGLVVDNQSGYYASGASTDVLTPAVNQSHEAYVVYENQFTPRMPQSHAIKTATSLPTGVSVTPLFTTSTSATRRELANVENILGEAGKMNVAVTAYRQMVNDNGTYSVASLTWFGSTEAFTDENAELTSDGNHLYLAVATSAIAGEFSSPYDAITGVRLSVGALDYMGGALSIILIALVVLVIPGGLLATGIVIWVKRKKRR